MSPEAAGTGVTVVVPVWDDYVRWLEEAVASVLEQGVAEQVIVVDNASLEPVPELPGTMVLRAPRRLSTGAARNLGLQAVNTPFVVFLDVDDVMLPDALSQLVTGIVARPDAVAMGMRRIDAATGRRHRSPRRIAHVLAGRPGLLALGNSVWSLLPTQGTMVMRTEVVREAGGYGDRSQGEDWVLGASLCWRGPILLDERTALLYRWRPDSPGRPQAPLTLRANARAVRDRLRGDDVVPAAVRLAMPLLGLLQLAAITVLRPVYIAARRAFATRVGHRG